jgi:hypothetical protein
MTVLEELSKHKLGLVGVQKVRWYGGGTELANTRSSTESGMNWYRFLLLLLVHKRIISAVKRVEFASDRMSYMILRDRWCDVTLMGVRAPTENKIDDVKDSFYEELERVFYKFPKYHMTNFLTRFQCESRQGTHTIVDKSLQKIRIDYGVRVVNVVTSKNFTVKSTMCSHPNIHKYICISPDGKPHNRIDHILIDT